MSLLHPTPSHTVLIGDPDPERADLLKDILKKDFGDDARCVSSFEQLATLLSQSDQWRLILIADTLPNSKQQPRPLLLRYFMLLSARWKGRLGCIVSGGREPDLKGIRNQPEVLRIEPGAADLAKRKAATSGLRRFKRSRFQREPYFEGEAGQTSRPRSQAYDQTDLRAVLANIERLNASIATDRQEIEELKRKKQKSLTVLNHALEE